MGVIGLGRTGTATLLSLLRKGYSDFVIADEALIAPSDTKRSDLFRNEDMGRVRSAVVEQRLKVLYPHARLFVGAGPEHQLGWHLEWLSRCRLCILAADTVILRQLWSINTACLDRRVPLLPGLVMGAVGQIGPLIKPDGPCLACLDLRVQTATRRSAFPPPVTPSETIAERVGVGLAEEAGRILASSLCPSSVEGSLGSVRVKYLWGTSDSSTHPLLRVPGCAGCGSRPPHMRFRSPQKFHLQHQIESDPYRILQLVPELVDSVTGPIKSLTRYTPEPADPPLQHWVAGLADPAWASFGHEVLFCGGNALTTEAAQAAAVGEAVERSSACQVAFEDIYVARYDDIAFEALDPTGWDLFHPSTRGKAGFPYVAISCQAETSWVWGYSLTQERPVRVPASRVFSPFRAIAPGDSFDGPIISGYCTSLTLCEAIYGALMEVIERDAFMIAWANQLRVPRLELDRSTRCEVDKYLAAFAERGIQVRCVLIDLDLGAHTVVAIARSDRAGDPASIISAAADLDAAAACRRALKELSANRLNVRHEMAQAGGSLPQLDVDTVIDERAHGLLYARREMVPYLDFWWNPDNSMPLPAVPPEPDIPTRLRRCIDVIRREGLEVVAVDLTPPAIASLGLCTVKVLIPGTYPMVFDGRFQHFGGSRISNAPVAAGLRKTPTRFEEFFTVPHPFP